jgi:hypothetical protein
MSQELRTRILLLLEQHSRLGSQTYKDDTALAEATSQTVEEIRRQLDILEVQGLITSANAFGGHSARISPKGSFAVEGLMEEKSEGQKPPIGFKTRND